MQEPGRLYLVPTPIGNLRDITLRSIDTLKSVDLILAEDTRTSGVLFKHFGITTPKQSFHAHNEHRQLERVLALLFSGKKLALISDAGTPGISDPGFLLVRECIKEEIEIECLPGPTALIPALVNSGLPSDRFAFEGFLPQKKGRQQRLLQIASEARTVVLFESPHRLVKLLEELEQINPEKKVSVSRELTKIHEETIRGNVSEVLDYFSQKTVKGEIVVVIEGDKQ